MGSLPRKVESRDIYMGSIPFILIQLVLVAIVIAVGVALYVAGYRDEITAILTQSPT